MSVIGPEEQGVAILGSYTIIVCKNLYELALTLMKHAPDVTVGQHESLWVISDISI